MNQLWIDTWEVYKEVDALAKFQKPYLIGKNILEWLPKKLLEIFLHEFSLRILEKEIWKENISLKEMNIYFSKEFPRKINEDGDFTPLPRWIENLERFHQDLFQMVGFFCLLKYPKDLQEKHAQLSIMDFCKEVKNYFLQEENNFFQTPKQTARKIIDTAEKSLQALNKWQITEWNTHIQEEVQEKINILITQKKDPLFYDTYIPPSEDVLEETIEQKFLSEKNLLSENKKNITPAWFYSEKFSHEILAKYGVFNTWNSFISFFQSSNFLSQIGNMQHIFSIMRAKKIRKDFQEIEKEIDEFREKNISTIFPRINYSYDSEEEIHLPFITFSEQETPFIPKENDTIFMKLFRDAHEDNFYLQDFLSFLMDNLERIDKKDPLSELLLSWKDLDKKISPTEITTDEQEKIELCFEKIISQTSGEEKIFLEKLLPKIKKGGIVQVNEEFMMEIPITLNKEKRVLISIKKESDSFEWTIIPRDKKISIPETEMKIHTDISWNIQAIYSGKSKIYQTLKQELIKILPELKDEQSGKNILKIDLTIQSLWPNLQDLYAFSTDKKEDSFFQSLFKRYIFSDFQDSSLEELRKKYTLENTTDIHPNYFSGNFKPQNLSSFLFNLPEKMKANIPGSFPGAGLPEKIMANTISELNGRSIYFSILPFFFKNNTEYMDILMEQFDSNQKKIDENTLLSDLEIFSQEIKNNFPEISQKSFTLYINTILDKKHILYTRIKNMGFYGYSLLQKDGTLSGEFLNNILSQLEKSFWIEKKSDISPVPKKEIETDIKIALLIHELDILSLDESSKWEYKQIEKERGKRLKKIVEKYNESEKNIDFFNILKKDLDTVKKHHSLEKSLQKAQKNALDFIEIMKHIILIKSLLNKTEKKEYLHIFRELFQKNKKQFIEKIYTLSHKDLASYMYFIEDAGINIYTEEPFRNIFLTAIKNSISSQKDLFRLDDTLFDFLRIHNYCLGENIKWLNLSIKKDQENFLKDLLDENVRIREYISDINKELRTDKQEEVSSLYLDTPETARILHPKQKIILPQ